MTLNSPQGTPSPPIVIECQLQTMSERPRLLQGGRGHSPLRDSQPAIALRYQALSKPGNGLSTCALSPVSNKNAQAPESDVLHVRSFCPPSLSECPPSPINQAKVSSGLRSRSRRIPSSQSANPETARINAMSAWPWGREAASP